MTTTFNPSDKSANSVLTNGNLTAAVNSSASGGVRATTSKGSSGGKYYVEYTLATSTPNLIGVGFASGAADLEDAVGGTGNSPIVRENGNIRLSGTNSGFIGASLANGDVVCCAVDFDNDKIWFRRNSSNWNNSGSDNPATNTGGLSISGFPDLFPYAGMDRASNTATANFGASGFAFTAPAGFSAWDAETPSSEAASSDAAAEAASSDDALSSDHDIEEAASSDAAASDAADSDEAASDARDSDEAASSDHDLEEQASSEAAEDASSDKPELDAASSSDKPANDAASSDDQLEQASSSEAAEEASSDKAEADAFSSDHHEEISSDDLVSDADLSERISSDIQDEIAAAPAPPIQTVLTLSS